MLRLQAFLIDDGLMYAFNTSGTSTKKQQQLNDEMARNSSGLYNQMHITAPQGSALTSKQAPVPSSKSASVSVSPAPEAKPLLSLADSVWVHVSAKRQGRQSHRHF
jgi:hypothetical protein